MTPKRPGYDVIVAALKRAIADIEKDYDVRVILANIDVRFEPKETPESTKKR